MVETNQFQEAVSTPTDGEGCCSPAPQPDAAVVEADVRLLSALASETRYEALRVLADAEGERCACEIERALPVSQSAVSQALGALYDAGLVERRKEGRWRYYRPTERARAVIETLDAVRSERR
ncbi:ArsR/SmtB family transcription factor [Halalkalicoccus jeotgali]|uniref:Putative transcriptional regulator n=1 Tax=Halalkalicoccus jeotgali (strain DSM 18796 / CECT 7217 / JCM 14584 / KCTC 4019 / B3) TaxID=795797 RepID=D8JAM6_HALJB|nr:metalloregulator ArsR/SmtB family transcription factor [Halalkalicoccus jeotgali]ADJ14748.1 putative transcription regulator [Halalkalicoccus jeotgali B3]ELY39330.1 putative transcriptional regulator [Halalkalicoccus jeotgali B3]